MRTFYLHQIDKWNILFIFICQFFRINFIYFRNSLEGKLQLPNNCRSYDDLNNPDLWVKSIDKSFKAAKNYYEKPFNLPERDKLKSINLYRSYIEFESSILESNFNFLNFQPKVGRVSMPFLLHPIFESFYLKTFFCKIDTIRCWVIAQKNLILKVLPVMFFLFLRRKKTLAYTGCVRGVSAAEIPRSDISLNCFWFSDEKIINPEENIFYYAGREVKSQAKSLNIQQDILTHLDLIKTFSISQKINIVLKMLTLIILNFLKFNLVNYFLSIYYYHSLVWKFYVQNNSLKFVITSISENWPSPPELEVINKLNVKTILWSYSYYGFRQTFEKLNSNQSLLMSTSSHKYIIMWDEEINFSLKNCEINIFDDFIEKKYFSSGPILNGRLSHFTITQEEALEKLQVFKDEDLFYISIFDLVAWKKDYRLAISILPFTTELAQDKFYNELIKLLEDIPNLVFLFKPKRGLANHLYLPKMREKILNLVLEKGLSERIIILKENIDPVLVIKASDFVVTSFFTSPSAIAMDLDIPNCFFEPSLQYNFIASKKIQCRYINDYFVLKNQILAAQKEKRRVLPLDQKLRIKTILNEILSDRT